MSVAPLTKPDNPRQASDRVYEEMAQAMRRKAMRDYDEDVQYKESGMGSNSAIGSSTTFVNAMLSIITGLILAGIVGEVIVYGEVQSLNTTVSMIVQGKIRIGP